MKLEDKIEITEKEFFKTCLQSREVFVNQYRDILAQVQDIDKIINDSQLYKSLGYKIRYYFIDNQITYEVEDCKIGFKTREIEGRNK